MINNPSFDIQQFIDRQHLGAFHWVVFFLSFSVLFADGFDTAAVGYIAPILITEWGIEKSALGPVLSAALFGLVIGAVAAGPMADRVGRKAVIVFFTAFFGVASLATALSTNLEMLTVLRFITGLGLGAAMPNAITLASEYVPVARRSLLTTAIFCGFVLGTAGGGLIAAWLIPNYGWRSIFVLGGALPIVLSFILLWKMPESLRYLVANGKPANGIRRILKRMTSDSLPAGTYFVVPEPAHAAGKRAVGLILSRSYLLGSLMLWLTYFMGLLSFYLLLSWLPTLMKDAGFAIEKAVLISSLFPFGSLIGIIIVGWLMDRMNQHRVIAAAFILSTIFIFSIGQGIANLTMLGALIFLSGIAINGAITAMPALAAQFYPTQGRATGVAWMLGLGRCGGIAGALLGAELMRMHIGFDMIFMLASIPAAFAAVALIIKLAAGGSQ